MNGESTLLSSVDAENLTDLLERLQRSYFADRNQIDMLARMLENAEVLPPASIPPEMVRIDCAVRVVDLRTGKKTRYTIVLPDVANPAKQLLSATAPIGIALLGRRQGEVVEVAVPGGVRLLRIERVRHLRRLVLPAQQLCHQLAYR